VDNQRLRFEEIFTNPPSTTQVMVAAARASMKLSPGAYTFLEVPLFYFLPGEKEASLYELV